MKRLKEKVISTLRWSERWTQTDMVYVASGISWITLGKVLSSIASFLFVVAFANLLPQETFGTYKYVLSIIAILGITSLPGMSNSVTRSVAQGYEGVTRSVVTTKIKWGLIGAVAGLAIAGYYYLNGNIVLGLSFLVTSIFLPFKDSFALYSPVLRGKKLFKSVSVYGTIKQFILVGATVVVLFLSDNLFLVLFTYFAVSTFVDMVILSIISFRLKLNKEMTPEVLSYGKHLSYMKVFGSVAQEIDKVLLWHYLGAVPLAVYSFALSPVLRLRDLITPITSLALPKLSTSQVEKESLKKKLLLNMIKMTIVVTVPLTIIYILFAPYFYRFVFPDYVDATLLSQVFALSLLTVPFSLTKTFLTARASKRYLYILSAINPFVKIGLLLVLLPLFGLWGAITALILSKFFSVCSSFFFFYKF